MNRAFDDQEKSVINNVPGIKDGYGKTMLYVGANKFRAYLFDMFREFGYKIDILEIWPPNIDIIKSNGRWDYNEVIEGDIRDINNLKDYDVVCWWHGPEHVQKEEFIKTLDVFNKKFKMIVLGGPINDVVGQGPEYGNQYETHLWVMQVEDFTDLGFETCIVERENTDHITAWKRGDKNVT